VIDYETFSRIKHLHELKGLTATQIARELGLDDRTVRLRINAKQYLPRKSVPRSSKLDPFKDTVIKMVDPTPIRPNRSISVSGKRALTAVIPL
jgi:hypothetical protein